MSKKLNLAKLTPVLFSFFVMGFVDIVNISTNYVKQDFALNDTWANLIPLLVFFWFAVISLPTGILMGRFGRKNTVLLSAAVTTVAMLLPLLDYSFPLVLTAFALLGIGNTILQVALNPLLMNVVPADRVARSLTLGQFIKAISSFLGPIIVGVASVSFGNWKLVFPVYAAVTVLSFVWLLLIPIPEQRESAGQSSSAGRIFAMLRDRRILVYFSVIVLIVGYEVGLLTTIPKYLTERCAIPLDEGGPFAGSLYFAARTIGTFVGTIILAKVAPRRFFAMTMCFAVAGYALLLLTGVPWIIYTALFVIGLSAASVFAIAFSLAMQHDPAKANEISALMITGVAGGALVPPVMGVIADHSDQLVSLLVPFACLVYILGVAVSILRKQKA